MMKKLITVSLLSLATVASASELDLQPGQWSVNLKPTEANLFFGSTKTDYPESNATDKTTSVDFSLQGSGTYALNEQVQVGGYARVFATKSGDIETAGGTTISDNESRDSGFQINPFVEYQVSGDFHARVELSYYYSGADVTTDMDGNETFTADNYNSPEIWLGGVYKKDINDKAMLRAAANVGIDWQNYEDEEDSSDTFSETYLRSTITGDVHYFLANNFSVDAGLGLYAGKLINQTNDGEEVDLSDFDWSYFNVGTRFGFTYYHR
ncbi:outer membrane beta-barrel protein [Reinekea blandensis]|nr:outer membrane beta-barrel protein [Reinekea blandensis]